MTRRRAIAGGIGLIASVVAYALACRFLPQDSSAQLAVSDWGFVVVEVAALALTCLAALRTRERFGRWVWALVALWIGLNLFADTAWAIYEAVLKVEVPSPGLADIGYLGGYVAAFAAVLVAAWKASGGLRTLETFLDATMLAIGAAALNWPYLLAPALRVSSPGTEYWVNLAYFVGDLLIIFAFASFFLGFIGSTHARPRVGYLVLCSAFLVQMVSDSAYALLRAANGDYSPGSWLDPVWVLAFAIAGTAALMEMYSATRTAVATASVDASAVRPRHNFTSSIWRTLIPYVGLPVLGAMLVTQLRGNNWAWDTDTKVLAYLGFTLVWLVLVRQYVTLAQNRGLNRSLSGMSSELEDKLDDLADVNERLAILNDQSHRLNSLRELSDVAVGGLELACSLARAPGGWITLKANDGEESVIAARGPVTPHRPGDVKFNSVETTRGTLRAMPLRVRGESLGTVWLIRPEETGHGPDLLPVVAAHIATAIDNTRRYEEALHLAERDPLTGLFNHRGIHKRLAGESLRAQQNGTELSLIMIDLDDFKLLNDTYGHPAGDSVLRQVSDAIRIVLRHADLAGRVGGDELLLVLPNTGSEGALQLSERLRETMASRPYVTAGGHAIPVRASLGVATYPGDAQSLGQLIETADANLYASKQRGGNVITSNPPASNTAVDAQGILGVAGRLLDVVGARDHYTRRHSEHVTLFALSLGQALELPEESLQTLHVAAMLHDVGKIGVPGELLQRPSSLSAGEHDLVRRHVDLGAAVISDMPRLARVIEAVQSHHEHHDGSGYPSEAAGDDIPLLGRILAVADAYSAMTLGRPYRKSMTHQQAREELLLAAGTQLDPQLVKKFLEIVDSQDGQRAPLYADAG